MYKQMMGATLVLILLVGCATPQLTPIPRGEPISIVYTASHKADGVSDISNDDLAGDAKVGAGTGATGGAVAGVLIATGCGPFFPICAPVLGAAGAVVGTATGAGVGAGVSIAGELSNEKAAQLRDRVARVQQSHSLQAELQKNVTDRAQKYWKLGSDQSAARVTVALQDLLLASKRDDQINCTIRVLVSVQRSVAKDSKATEQKMYQYAAPTSSLSIWLDESNDFVDTVLTSGTQQIATQIVSDLAMTGNSAEAKAPAKTEGKDNSLSASRSIAPTFSPVVPLAPLKSDDLQLIPMPKNLTSAKTTPKGSVLALDPSEPWTGKWKVEGSPITVGLWVLKQRGLNVVSTSESYFEATGSISGNELQGNYSSVSFRRGLDFKFILSEDKMSFTGYAEDQNGIKPVSGFRQF